ncbi:MAG: hypothetical protein ACE15C_18420 [Phycisphaerae bacterium]
MKNGVVVPDRPGTLPEGVEVSIRPLKRSRASGQDRPRTMYERYKRCIGIAKGLPPDASTNADHYLYGAPKRK